jgi:eukaryotic-like serine/threonine-protein kinase
MSGDHNQSSSLSPAPGGKLKGRYLIERELGRGGVGVVFLARDERLHGMPVVIKFLLEDAGRNRWLIGKFSQEAEALTRINHPGVVRVIDRDLSDDGRPFFVMEFIKGRPLRDVMGQGPLDLTYIAHLARQTGSALHAAHQQGVFHRDLKPENIMLEQLSGGDEQVKLIDFGIAKVVNPQAGNETEVAVVAGSRQYIAPEQLLSQTASPATDVYALAIIVYEMVTGRLPFNPEGPTHFLVMQELMRLQKGESFVTPRTFRPDLPEAAQILLLNALSFDPGRRPQNSRIFTEDLAQALVGKISVSDARATIAVPAPVPGSAHVAGDPLETQIDPIETIENPIQARETAPNVAARTSAPISPRSETNPIKERKEASAKPKGGKFPIVAGLIIAIGVAAAAGVVGVPRLYAWLNTNVTPTPTPLTATPSPAAPGAERSFTYWITVRQNPKNFPGKAPFQVPGEMMFAGGDQIHISFTSPQSGYLYIINESPTVAGQDSSFNILFPTPTTNQGSSQLPASQTIRIPDHNDGLVFDDNERGAEKLWMVWSVSEVPELEILKNSAYPQDGGEIKNAVLIKTLREFLAARSVEEPQVTRDETSKQTSVKMKGEILVKLVKLEHY